jgi:hypothetical protein
VCQDFGFRLDQLKDALIFTDAETEIYPIWCRYHESVSALIYGQN